MVVGAGSTRLSPLARRLCLGLLGLGAVYGALVLVLSLVPLDSTVDQKDFGQEYLLARAILDRADPYQPIQVLGARYVGVRGYFDKPYPTPHPPTVGVLALPLGLLSYPDAVRVWFGFELACLVGSVILLVRGAGLPLRLRTAPVLAIALVGWPSMTLELGLGQLMLPILLGLGGAQIALLTGRSVLAGGLLGLTLLIKPIAWPWLILLVWRRDWHALTATGVIVLAGACLSVVVVGAEPAINYLTRVLPAAASAFVAEPTNMSLWTVTPRLGNSSLNAVLPATLTLLAIWWSSRPQPLAAALAMLTIASLLASPIVWHFYLILALIPLATVVAALQARGFRRAEVAAALGAFGLMSASQSGLMALGRSGIGMGVLLEPLLGLVLLGILLAWLTSLRLTRTSRI